jgi:heme/copper-type cytochrome/quinol oxidase subunit 2
MSLQQQLDPVEWSQWLVQLVIALITMSVGIRFRQTLLGLVVGVVAAWIAVNVMRFYLVIPLREAVWAQDESKMPSTDSDIAGNVALLVFGWVIPLVSLLLVLLCRYLWHRLCRRSDTQDMPTKVA